MYQTYKVYIEKDMILSDLVLENPSLLLLLDFLNIEDALADHSIETICQQHAIHLNTFLVLANLYSGFRPNFHDISKDTIDLPTVISFLKNTHQFYIQEKYPQIKRCVTKLYDNHKREEIKQIEFFFNDYFEEVLEHLRYEDEVAFPYFQRLSKDTVGVAGHFSGNEYRTHHSDIETKLSDLKNLMIKHIDLNGSFDLKRKFITRLYELEQDLGIHSLIEDAILLPIVDQLEKENHLA